MGIAIGMVGLGLTMMGVILAYIWKANGRYIHELMEGQKVLMEGLQRLMDGQQRLMEGQERLMEGLGEIAKIVGEVIREVRALVDKSC